MLWRKIPTTGVAIAMVLSLMVAACTSTDSEGNGDSGVDTTEAAPDTTADDSTTNDTDSDEGTTTEPEVSGGSLTISTAIEPPTLDISVSQGTDLVRVLLYNVYETLVTYDYQTAEIVPLLAESWETSDDGTVYTFTIRENASFSTGAPVTASDVVFSIETQAAGPNASRYSAMESVEAVDDRTVEITLSRPSNLWFFEMTKRSGAIFPQEGYDDLASNPVGSGPFMLDEWRSGESITLVPNPHYDGAPPALDEVTFVFINDMNAAVNALLSNEIDVLLDLQTGRERASEIEDAGFTLREEPTTRIRQLAINVARDPISDVRVRRAMAHAIDKQAMMDGIAGGFGVVVGSWSHPGDAWYEDEEPYPYDPDRARELLAEAGYPDGFSTEIKTRANDITTDVGELAALMLAEVGIDATVTPLEVAVFREEITVGNPPKMNYDVTVTGAEHGIHFFTNGIGWFTNWNNEAFNQLIAEADTASSDEERNAIMAEAVDLWGEELPMIPIYNDVNVAFIHPDIVGWDLANRHDQATGVASVSWAR